ncbi:MAG: alpha-2-macroglobulin, partial [Chromatiales bacterium]|nr:alpha-2-macroglobulin [Chromatiales bacterium]
MSRLLQTLFGQISWTPPRWFALLCRHRGRAVLLLLGLLLALFGYLYYQALPQPLHYQVLIEAPTVSPLVDDKPQPAPLTIRFRPSEPEAPASVANLALLDRVLSQGIALSPALAGEWRWRDDQVLQFIPAEDWPAEQAFQLQLGASLFRDGLRLDNPRPSFRSAPLHAELHELNLYQDPQQGQIRRALATLHFSHAVDAQSLEQLLRLGMRPSGAGRDVPLRPIPFELQLAAHGRIAYLQSAPLSLPNASQPLHLDLPAGLLAAKGKAQTAEALHGELMIPDRDSLFRIEQASLAIVANQAGEPEQILSLQFSDDLASTTLAEALEIYLLPERRPAWRSPREVDAQVLAQAERLALDALPNQREAEPGHHLRLDVPGRRQLYLRLPTGLVSAHDFVLREGWDQLLHSPEYPREVTIAGEGSVLSLSGERRLGLLSRNLEALQVSVARVLPGQLNHLVTQSHGDISNPIFAHYPFREENLSQSQRRILPLASAHPRQANHASLDLAAALRSDDGYGLFFVEVQGWDPVAQRPHYGVGDKRLILITDLGLIVKDNNDGSREVFVQSLHSGLPVAGAQVELLGRNGLAVRQARTDARGHARLADTRGLEREQQPSVYLVRHGEDVAFLPFERGQRQLNLSRFEVGGEHHAASGDRLSAYLFSDRGIYRPGERVELAAIVRQQNLALPAAIPLALEIRNPRGTVVLNRRLSLPSLGIFELAYDSEAHGETGQYQASLYLVRDGARGQTLRGQQIGQSGFLIEEFEADTLRIHTRLPGSAGKAWLRPQQFPQGLQAEVRLENLFGSPAQDRRIEARYRLSPSGFYFREYAEYRFDDPSIDPQQPLRQIEQALEARRSDAQGQALFPLPLAQYPSGTYRLAFHAEGFEPGGGRQVSASSEVLISPLEALLGYRADGPLDFIRRDAERQLSLIAIDQGLQPIALDGLRLQRLERQQISTLVRQPNGVFVYQSVERETLLDEQPYALSAEGNRYRLPSDQAGDFVLQLLDGAGQRLARIPYTVVGEANLGAALEKNAELRLRLDKTDYRPGEWIELNITAPYTGSGLISIESDRVHAFSWFRSDRQSSMQRIRVPEGLEGNAYLNVAFVRAADSPEIFVSPLSYAVAPFTIDRSQRQLKLDIETPERARPGEELAIRYRSETPAKLLIIAVDEGILQVADHATPAPLNHFLRKRALQVRTQQMLDLILPEYRLLLERSASGGDMLARSAMMEAALGSNLNPFARAVEKPVAFWSGLLDVGPEDGHYRFTLPEHFNGQLRIMAVAVSAQAMASVEQHTLVRAPFVLSPNAPLMVAPGDEFTLSVGVANMLEGGGEGLPIRVALSSDEGLTILGDSEHLLGLDTGSEGRVEFRLRAGEVPGGQTLHLRASHDETVSRRSTSLSIRPALPYQTSLLGGRSESGKAELSLPRQLLPQLAEQQLSASASPLVLSTGLLRYLEHFPHGCTEQLVSQVFPLIGLGQHAGYAPQRAEFEQRIAAMLQSLRSRQQADGGFVLWPGQRASDPELSLYVAHFLLAARQQGHAVPSDMLNPLLGQLRRLAQQPQQDLEQARQRASAIYLLIRNGEVMSNQLVHLHEGLQREHAEDWQTTLLASYLAASYQLLRKQSEAEALIGRYRPQPDGAARHLFQDRLSQDAQHLYLLAQHFPQRLADLPTQRLDALLDPILAGEINTHSAAWSILALGAWGKAVLGSAGVETIAMEQRLADTWQALETLPQPFVHASPSVEARALRLQGQGPLFYQLVQAGFERELPEQALRQGLEIQREYLDGDGQPVSEARVGQELTVRLRLRSTEQRHHQQVAVIDLLPGGFAVARDSLSREPQIGIPPMPQP